MWPLTKCKSTLVHRRVLDEDRLWRIDVDLQNLPPDQLAHALREQYCGFYDDPSADTNVVPLSGRVEPSSPGQWSVVNPRLPHKGPGGDPASMFLFLPLCALTALRARQCYDDADEQLSIFELVRFCTSRPDQVPVTFFERILEFETHEGEDQAHRQRWLRTMMLTEAQRAEYEAWKVDPETVRHNTNDWLSREAEAVSVAAMDVGALVQLIKDTRVQTIGASEPPAKRSKLRDTHPERTLVVLALTDEELAMFERQLNSFAKQ
jgi:hypothetical protein